jgi:predicted  nucleic acid-binding Zn-ribbon protein
MGQINLLYHLQQIDDEVREDKKRLEQVVRLQTESDALLDARDRAVRAVNDLKAARSQQSGFNLELNSLNDKIKRSNNRLYSGLVKNPKELEDLQHEIESLNRRQVVLEDELLEAMILVEEAEEEDAQASDASGRLQADWENDQKNLKAEQASLIERINELSAQRKHQLEMIRPEFIRAYKNTVRRVGNLAVVALTNKRCRGCLVTVPANHLKAADEGQLVNCDSCTRILCPV